MKAVRKEEVKLQRDEGFVKQVGFKTGLKDRSGESKEVGEGISVSEIQELVPEVDEEIKRADSRDKG